MAAAVAEDERVSGSSGVTKVLKRPESGAMVAALVIFAWFSFTTDAFATSGGSSTWLLGSSTIGIMAVAVALLMIGGEFDLSAGAMTGFTGLLVGVLTTEYGLNIWVAILVALVLALAVGALNGVLVMKTGLPSFIVTLGTFFVLQGVDLAGTKALIGQVAIQGMSRVRSTTSPGCSSGRRCTGVRTAPSTLGVLVGRGDGGGDVGADAHPSVTGSSRWAARRGRPGRSGCPCSGPRWVFFS